MKTFLVCALMALVPCSSLRIVCVEAHDAGAVPRATMADDETAASATQDESECDRVCKRRPAPRPPAPAVACVLVSDPSCSFLATLAVAVMPGETQLQAGPAVRLFEAAAGDEYRAPLLTLHGPPPKA